jgi:1,5-anhydro-D-fructose reductase (1,5-anhydro-D-mannitol-forming)
MNAPIGLGIVGYGWAAGEIARVAPGLDGLRIAAATDTDPARAQDLAERIGARVVPDLGTLLADPGVEAVYVGLPHHLLASVTEAALLAGRHVLAEKPLALSAAEAVRLGALADTLGLKLGVFFELRKSGPIELARRLVAAGAIGRPRLVRIRTVIDKKLSYWGTDAAPSWRAGKAQAGGGVVLMNTIHQLDTLRYVTGLDYIRATGEIDTFIAPAEVEDAAAATLRLSNGAIVSVAAAAHSPGGMGEETIEIDGDRGRLDLPYPFGADPLRLYDGAWSELPTAPVDMHSKMLQAFLDAVRLGGPVPATARDAAAALGAVSAIYRSAAEGRCITIAPLG